MSQDRENVLRNLEIASRRRVKIRSVGRVMVFGTFDVFHPGHRFFIEQAMKRGKELVIVVARDETVRKIKPSLRTPEEIRKKILEEAFPKAIVVLGDTRDYLKVVREYRPDLVCLGYDQIGFSKELEKAFPELPRERIRAFHPECYKSSLVLKKRTD